MKDKERILKASREKQLVTYKGAPIRLVDNFSAETLQARREWRYIFKVMKGKNLQKYSARLQFRFDREIKKRYKQTLGEFSTTKPALQHMLKEFFQAEKATTRKREIMDGKAH